MSYSQLSHETRAERPLSTAEYRIKLSGAILDAATVLALFVIGSLALIGKLNGVVAGGTVIGLSGASLIAVIVQGKRRRSISNKCAVGEAVISIALIVIAALAMKGILPTATLGKVTLITASLFFVSKCISLGFLCSFEIYYAVKKKKQATIHPYS